MYLIHSMCSHYFYCGTSNPINKPTNHTNILCKIHTYPSKKKKGFKNETAPLKTTRPMNARSLESHGADKKESTAYMYLEENMVDS